MTEQQKKPSPTYAAPLVEKMLDIVEYMAEAHASIGVTELARVTGHSSNSIFRIMRCLAERGYAEIDPDSRNYWLGSKFFTLGMRLSHRFDLRKKARPHLEQLAREVNETCQIHIADGDHVLVLDVATPDMPFYIQIVPGSKLNYHSNAFGKCILAFQADRDILATLPETLERLEDATITDHVALLENIHAVRETGLGYDLEEYARGLYCVGSPVLDVDGKAVAGLGMTGMKVRFHEENMREFQRAVLTTASRLAADIGYSGDYYTACLAKLQ